MQVDVKIDSTVDEMKILVIADKEGHTVDTFVDYIRDYERKQVTKLMAYKGDTAYLINISDILRIYAGNQKVFVETQQNEYIVRYRLYELEELLEKKTFLRISNSEIVESDFKHRFKYCWKNLYSFSRKYSNLCIKKVCT